MEFDDHLCFTSVSSTHLPGTSLLWRSEPHREGLLLNVKPRLYKQRGRRWTLDKSPSLFSVAMRNTMTENNLEKRSLFWFIDYSLSSREAGAGAQTEPGSRHWGKGVLLTTGLLSVSAQLNSFYNTGPPTQGWPTYRGLGPPPSISSSKQAKHWLQRHDLVETDPHLRFPLPHMYQIDNQE